MGTKNLGLTQYPNATGNTILANWNSDAEKIDNAITSDTKKQIHSFTFLTSQTDGYGSGGLEVKWLDNGDDLSVIKKENIDVTFNTFQTNDYLQSQSGKGIRITFNKKINILYIDSLNYDNGVITSITDSTITIYGSAEKAMLNTSKFIGTIFYTNID